MMVVLGKIVLAGAGYAAGGTIAGSIGAKVMQDAGYDGYDILEAVRTGAAGGAVVGATIGILKELFHLIDVKYHITSDEDRDFHRGYEHTWEKFVGEMVVSIGAMAAAGAIGHEMLMEIAKMSLGMTVAALAVGEAVFAGAFLALGACCCCCLLCCKGTKNRNENGGRGIETPRLSALRSSIGGMWNRDSDEEKAADTTAAPPAAGSIPAPGGSPV